MRNLLIYIVLLGCLLLPFTACTKVPKDVVPEKTMENILYDSYLGEGLSETELTPLYDKNARDVYFKSVLNKYEISRQQYDASINWYMLHLDIYSKIYEKVLNRLKKESSKFRMESGSGDVITDVAKGDTVELWRKNGSTGFSGLPLIGNTFTEIRYNETFQLGDSLVFSAVARSFNRSHRQSPVMVLTLQYQDESLFTSSVKLEESRSYRIAIATDTTKRLNSIVAGFYQNHSAALLLDQISLKRMHKVIKPKHK